MAWNSGQADALRLQFEQFLDPREVQKTYENSQDEYQMIALSGGVRDLQQLNIKKGTPNGAYLRVDYKLNQNTYAVGRPQGVGARLPGSGEVVGDRLSQPKTVQGKFTPSNIYLQTGWDGPADAAVKDSKGGYENLVNLVTVDAMEGMLSRLSMDIAGTRLGILGRIQAEKVGSDYSKVRIHYAGNNQKWAGVQRFLQGGFAVDAVNGVLGSVRNDVPNARGRWVESVSKDTGNSSSPYVEIQLDTAHGAAGPPATGWQAGDYLVMYNSRQTLMTGSPPTTYPTMNEIENGMYGFWGMLDAIDDGTLMPWYGQIQRSAYPQLTSTVLANGGTLRAFSPILANDAIDLVFQLYGKRNGSPMAYGRSSILKKAMEFAIKTVATNFDQETPSKYQGDKESPSLKVGFNTLELMPYGVTGKMRFWASRNAPTHTLMLFYPEDLQFWHDGPPKWLDKTPNNGMRTPGTHEYTAALWARIMGIVNLRPNRHVRLDDLSGDHVAALG